MFEIRQAKATGVAHRASGAPCQDAVATAATASGRALLAVADGAGSQPLSQHGATAAVDEAVAFAVRAGAAGSAQDTAAEAIRAARRAVEECAGGLGVALDEVACTLSVAVLDDSACAIASVGDGVHLVRNTNGTVRPVAMGGTSDFANLTHFLTQREYEARLVAESFPTGEVDSVALSSDGLDGILLYGPLDARWVFRPAADRLLDSDGNALPRLLASDAVTTRCQDDLSIALARRVREAGADERPATLSDGRVVDLDPVAVADWPGGHRAWPVVDLPGAYLVQPAEALRPDCVDIVDRPPRCWTPRSPLPLVSWPSAAALDENRRPWSLLIRDPGGQPAVGSVAADEPIGALHQAGYAHGSLSPDRFRVEPSAGTVCLVDPLPAFVAGGDQARRRRTDERFLEASRGGRPLAGSRGRRSRRWGWR